MIYFVEDDADIRKLVCYALKKEGYDICGFELPSEFWNEIKKQRMACDLTPKSWTD